ncbi:MAG: methyltransferase domain-containing protein [Candidatus Rariloculaceae bacterium]
MSNPTPIGLPEPVAAAKRFERVAVGFDEADFVHAEARRRLLERLQMMRLDPRTVLDLGSATAKASIALAEAFPGARVVAVDRSLSMLGRAAQRADDRFDLLAADAERLPFPDHSIDLLFSNLLLPWCRPDQLFAEAARVLTEGGLFSFTTVGPDTLAEVRQAWTGVDDDIHVHGFIDMHDLGDLVVRAGLTEPVMDVDRLQVTYTDVEPLVADLRSCGAANVAAGRRETLTGRGRWASFRDALVSSGVDGRFAVTVELIFGQAWGSGAPRQQKRGEARFSLAEMERQIGQS